MAMTGPVYRVCRRITFWLFLSVAGLSVGGCSVAHMALPEGAQDGAREYPVKGLGTYFLRGSFDFAPYRVSEIHRGWIKGAGWSIWAFSDSKAKQKYRFTVTDEGGAARNVRCVARADWNKADLEALLGVGITLEFSYDRSLVCAMKKDNAGEALSKLVMRQSSSELIMEGAMLDGDTRIDISVTYNFDSSPLKAGDPTGYWFHIGDRYVGAVEVINSGTVWIHDSVQTETRSALAAAAAVLLMHQDIKKVQERS